MAQGVPWRAPQAASRFPLLVLPSLPASCRSQVVEPPFLSLVGTHSSAERVELAQARRHGHPQVSESSGTRAAMRPWALAQMRDLQMQMQQLHRIEAAMAQPLLASSLVPIALSDPMLIRLPGPSLPLDMSILQPEIVSRMLLPARVIVVVHVLTTPRATSLAADQHQSQLI